MIGRAIVLVSLGCVLILASTEAYGQAAQVGMDRQARGSDKLLLEHVHYRPARWETEKVTEYENEFPNQGGLLYFYLSNVHDAPINLRFWQFNGHDESYWLLNHFIAWHRLYDHHLEPGQSTVLEIDAISKDFALETEFKFRLVESTWRPCLRAEGVLREDPVNVSYIRVLPNMQDLELHLRYQGKPRVTFTDAAILGRDIAEVQWRGQELGGPGTAIARIKLSEPVPTSTLLIARVGFKTKDGERSVCAHRRAFPEFFPIGTWGGNPKHEEFLARDHVDTQVKGGSRNDAFFGESAAKYGLHALVHTGEPVNVDMVRDLSGHPNVTCWMLRDEPDWSLDPQIILFCDTTVRKYDSTIPTFVNLCRNAKYFEYAPIGDIPGHDHYCVSAPSSSKWPHRYGTYLEETGYYTRDLKYASEPKPIWVWSQGNHGGWGERPKRPLPTPEELGAQLVLNIGRGANGILWFTYNHEMSEKYPETRESMRGWNRVMAVLRDDFLACEPADLKIKAPEKVDVAALVGWDAVVLCITNLNYEIHPEAYPFETQRDVTIKVDLPDWVKPKAALHVAGDGVHDVGFKARGGSATVTLDALVDGAIIVLATDPDAGAAYRAHYEKLLADETRDF
ncbi:MAG: hypothetical protein GY851_24925 [bacterium]|nr:hypothetical protein [bacterium]